MSIEELQHRVRSSEALLDRLVAANASERSALLDAYTESKRNESRNPSNHSINAYHRSQITGTAENREPSNPGQDATLAVLGCGKFSTV